MTDRESREGATPRNQAETDANFNVDELLRRNPPASPRSPAAAPDDDAAKMKRVLGAYQQGESSTFLRVAELESQVRTLQEENEAMRTLGKLGEATHAEINRAVRTFRALVGRRSDFSVMLEVLDEYDRHRQRGGPRTNAATARITELESQVRTLQEWRDAICGLLETFPEFQSGKWAGDKRGWGYCFELIKWLHRDRRTLQEENEAMREVWKEREGWKRTASERGFRAAALEAMLLAVLDEIDKEAQQQVRRGDLCDFRHAIENITQRARAALSFKTETAQE